MSGNDKGLGTAGYKQGGGLNRHEDQHHTESTHSMCDPNGTEGKTGPKRSPLIANLVLQPIELSLRQIRHFCNDIDKLFIVKSGRGRGERDAVGLDARREDEECVEVHHDCFRNGRWKRREDWSGEAYWEKLKGTSVPWRKQCLPSKAVLPKREPMLFSGKSALNCFGWEEEKAKQKSGHA